MNKIRTMIFCLVILSFATAQPYHFVDLNIESGVFNGDPTSEQEFFLVFSIEVGEMDAPYLRLYFGESNLGNNSYVIIRSIQDSIKQIHNSQTLSEWRNTSIFFNGSLLLIELYVYKFDTDVFINLDSLFIGHNLSEDYVTADTTMERSLCGDDDRIRSEDFAIGRLVPFVCTAGITENGLLISAGHCLWPDFSMDDEIVEFNVPFSLPDGTIQHPGVEDQYIVGDYYSFEWTGEIDDWLVFNVENNSNTGLQPIEAQGTFYELERVNEFNENDMFRITGYGMDDTPPDDDFNWEGIEFNHVQQTSTGLFDSLFGTILNIAVDATDGNSGGPVVRECDGKVVSIYNVHNCNNGYNSSVSFLNNNFWMALHPNSVFLTNRNLVNNENLGGFLTLDNTETSTFEYPFINSYDMVPVDVEVGNLYSATTTTPNLGENDEFRNIMWNDNREDYLLKMNHIFMEGQQFHTAYFTTQFSVTIESTHPVELEFHDPWYAYREEPDRPWIQPDEFSPLCELTPDGTYPVFLNQGGNIEYLMPPYYSILTEQYFDNDEGEIYEFTHWSGVNVLIENIDELATGVIFTNEDATITANYEFYTENGNLVNNITNWNIVGLPGEVPPPAYYLDIFPSAIEGTCTGHNGSYYNADNLVNGEGYWLCFNEAGNTIIIGDEISELVIDISSGWNLISGISTETPIEYIDDPNEILVPNCFFGYDNGFLPSESMVPGKGYWVRANNNGIIFITNDQQSTNEFVNRMDNVNYIKFTNPSGNERKVYFGIDVPEEDQLSYTLPPLPPDEVMEQNFMDTRFADGKTYTEDVGTIEVRNTDYPLTVEYGILNDNGEWEITSNAPKRINGDEEYGDIGRVKLNRTGKIVVEHPIESFTIRKTNSKNLPTEFALKQNYPNPFNPTTTISFSIPQNNVETRLITSLHVYDLTGRLVKTLINENIEPGYHFVVWNGTDTYGKPVASGMYLYQLKTNNFVNTKKLVLLK